MIKIFKHSLLIFNFLHLFLYRSECFAHSRKKKKIKKTMLSKVIKTRIIALLYFSIP